MADQKLTVHGTLGNNRTYRALVTAKYAGVNVEFKVHDWKSIKDKDFLAKKNPLGKIPVLETSEGAIFESNAIIRYIARLDQSKGLYGSSAFEQGQVDQWLDFATSTLDPVIGVLYMPVFGWSSYQEDQSKKAHGELNNLLKILDNHLKVNNVLVGNRVTIADISLACLLMYPFRFIFEEKYRKNISNVTRWFEFLTQQDQFKQVWGTVRLCVKELKAFVDEDEHKKGKEGKAKEGKGQKQEAKEPKEAKKPAAKKNDDDDEEAPAKKEKNPLDTLPPSKFDLFAFKTLYVNATDKKEALKFLWDNFDPEGYSIWTIKYIKAEGEGKVVYQTNNLASGFLQRLETFRKYAFGVHGVYGEEPNLEVQGCWLWRGTEIPFEMKDHPSFEYHTFTKLDNNKPEHRKLLEEYWTGLNEDDKVEGLRAREVKYFK